MGVGVNAMRQGSPTYFPTPPIHSSEYPGVNKGESSVRELELNFVGAGFAPSTTGRNVTVWYDLSVSVSLGCSSNFVKVELPVVIFQVRGLSPGCAASCASLIRREGLVDIALPARNIPVSSLPIRSTCAAARCDGWTCGSTGC